MGTSVDPLGVTQFNRINFDVVGSTVIDNVTVKVVPPNSPPNCTTASPSVTILWPPNHKFVDINANDVTDPDGDDVIINIESIYQDEPVNGAGDGDTAPDGQGVGTHTAQVRAERDGNGNGRVYHISFTADDGRGGTCSGTVQVGVPHSKKGIPIDDGSQYDSTQS